jgi:hypothetical protein
MSKFEELELIEAGQDRMLPELPFAIFRPVGVQLSATIASDH